MKSHRHIALLLAGGNGVRMNTKRPKQFLQIDGESILLHTMRAFQRHPLIQDIYVVCADEWMVSVEQEAKEGGIRKFRSAIQGGVTGFDSLRNGIKALADTAVDSSALVLVHDAVRPLITQDIISRNIAVCLTHGNAITALGSNEAFLISKDEKSSTEYIPREGILRAQTPHTFPLATLKQMMEQAKERGITHSQSLFTLANEVGFTPLYIAQGDTLNFKITVPQDILIYQALKNAPLLFSIEEDTSSHYFSRDM